MEISSEEKSRRQAFGDRFIGLTEKVAGGDSVAENELLGHVYGDSLVRRVLANSLRSILPGHVDLEDVLLKVFQKVVESAENGQTPTEAGKVIAWLRRVSVNTALDLRRMPRHNVQTSPIEDDLFGSDDGGHFSTPSGLDPERSLQSRMTYDQHEDCVSRLSDRQKEAWLLYFADYKYKEIAEFLEIEVNTVGATIHSARKSLRPCMESAGYSFSEEAVHAD